MLGGGGNATRVADGGIDALDGQRSRHALMRVGRRRVLLEHERMQIVLDEALQLGKGFALLAQAMKMFGHGKGDVAMVQDPARHLMRGLHSEVI